MIGSVKNKSCNVHSIPVFIYKHVSNLISPLISDLVNESFASGIFPAALKSARVVPIFKNGDRTSMSNYRPISILHFVSKIFEKLICKRLTSFLDKFNIIVNSQYGFRRNKSTIDALLLFSDNVYDTFNNSEYMLSVLIDFSKAFDTVQHNVLIRKLEYLGIRGMPLELLRSYLSNRDQYVCIDGASSNRLPIKSGVPQGSVLGPLLFLIYINDMHKSLNLLKLVQFADDTTAFASHHNLHELIELVNDDLTQLDTWLCSNRLSLNLSKTCYILFSNRNKDAITPVSMRHVSIPRVSQAKFLGITVDERLNFSSHISVVQGRVSRACGALSRLRWLAPSDVLLKVYYSLVYSHLTYGICLWGNSSKTAICKLDNIHTRCVKHVAHNVNLECNDIFKAMGLLSTANIFMYFTLLKFFEYRTTNCSDYFEEKLDDLKVIHNYNTRFSSNDCINLPVVSKSKCLSSFIFNSVKFWNKIPPDIRNINSKFLFKKHLKSFLVRNFMQ